MSNRIIRKGVFLGFQGEFRHPEESELSCPEGSTCSSDTGECLPIKPIIEGQSAWVDFNAAAARIRPIRVVYNTGELFVPTFYDHTKLTKMDSPPKEGKIINIVSRKEASKCKGIYSKGTYYYDKNKVKEPSGWRY